MGNGRDSFQLFVGVFDTCLVWYLLVVPSGAHAVANVTSLRPIDGNTSYHSREPFSLIVKKSSSYFLFSGLDRYDNILDSFKGCLLPALLACVMAGDQCRSVVM